MTGAILSVKSGDIENRTVVDVNQSLQGKTAGVQMISSSAAPGTESSIRVRVNSIVNIDPWLQISSQNSVTYHAQNSLAENDPYVSVLRAALALDPLTRNTYPASALPKNMQELLDNGRKLVSDGEGNYYGISKFQLGDDINPYILINTRSQRTWGTFTQGNTALNFKPIKGLVFTSRLGYRFASMFNNIYQAAYYATAARNEQDPTVNQTATQKKYYQWENFANYNMSIAKNDITMIGSAIPDLTYGLTINLGYKNFDLTVFGQGTAGNDIYCALVKTDRPSTNRLATYFEDAWTAPGQNAKIPRPSSTTTCGRSTTSRNSTTDAFWQVRTTRASPSSTPTPLPKPTSTFLAKRRA